MSQQINQAVGQVRLTNVAIVRLKLKKKRYEIACYKNKVLNWRNGQETNLEEVLQIHNVFHNVSKGEVAKKKDLMDAFETVDREAICRVILSKGELQVSDKERDAVNENKFKEIATIVAAKCVNPKTMRPYPVSTIEAAMRETIHYAVISNKSAKQQALQVIRSLESHLALKRAQMLVKVTVPVIRRPDLQLDSLGVVVVDSQVEQGQYLVQVLVNPGSFRELSDLACSLEGSVEVKEFTVAKNTEGDVEDEVAHHVDASKDVSEVAAAVDLDVTVEPLRIESDIGPIEGLTMEQRQKMIKKQKKKQQRRINKKEEERSSEEEKCYT